MGKHQFYIKSLKSKGKASVYTTIRIGKHSLVKICTGVKVDVAAWRRAQESAAAYRQYSTTEAGKKVVDDLATASEIIDRCVAQVTTSGTQIADTIAGVLGLETDAKIKELRLKKEGNVLSYLDNFIKDIAEGRITKDAAQMKRYSVGTVKTYRLLRNKLAKYLGTDATKFTFDDITAAWAQRFIRTLACEMMQGGVTGYTTLMHSLCRRAVRDGINTNNISLEVWHTGSISTENMRTQTFLSESELAALCRLRLLGTEAVVRDVFVLGAKLGLRYSDYSRLSKDMFDFSDDITTLTLIQRKTRRAITIPIVDKQAVAILEKYDYTLPQMNRLKFAERGLRPLMKKFAHTKAGLSLMSTEQTLLTHNERVSEEHYIELLHTPYKNLDHNERVALKNGKSYAKEHGLEGKDQLFLRDSEGNVLKYRYELVNTHVARRSFVSNGILEGVDSRDLMAFTGHTTEKMLEKYDKLAAKYKAKLLAKRLIEQKKARRFVDINAAVNE